MPRVALTREQKKEKRRQDVSLNLWRSIRHALQDAKLPQKEFDNLIGSHATVRKKIGKSGNPLLLTVGDILVLEDKLNPYFNLAVALENIKKTGVLK